VSATDIIVKQTERRKSIFKYNTERTYRIKNRLIYTMEENSSSEANEEFAWAL
jgi:hypothetical protein